MAIIRGSCLKKVGGDSNLLQTMILSGWQGGRCSPELMGAPILEGAPDLKGGLHTPLHTMYLVLLHIIE